MFKPLLALALCLALPLCATGEMPKKPINLNTATATELMQLPRVGAKTAERIIAFRKQNGSFKRIEEIMNVKGIGEKTFGKLKPFLTLGNGTTTSNP